MLKFRLTIKISGFEKIEETVLPQVIGYFIIKSVPSTPLLKSRFQQGRF